MRLYVASKFENVGPVREIQDFASSIGYTITKDWTKSGPPTKQEAEEDLYGVQSCDVFVGIFDKEYEYKGAVFEMGVAYNSGASVIILGDWLDKMVFMLLPGITKVATMQEVKEELERHIGIGS